jgi:DNA-binding protein HU-beta
VPDSYRVSATENGSRQPRGFHARKANTPKPSSQNESHHSDRLQAPGQVNAEATVEFAAKVLSRQTESCGWTVARDCNDAIAGEKGGFFAFPLASVGFRRYPCATNMAKALTKSQIAASLAETVGLTKKQAVQTLEALVALAYKNAKNSFTIPGLGKIVLVNRKARMGRNPATGETIQIKAKRVVKFRVAKAAKDAILGTK